MKQKDIALITVIAVFSAVIAFLLTRVLITTPENRQQEVEVVAPITSDFQKPSEQYFNASSVNPTKTIRVGEGVNEQPFQ
ncbi:hypothetical protein CR970_01640 [Candidatus Saccharibacteria bacterium]|nr:MAG: hypothetical protein CR970_01640 [Candidatus Saccharibacteria bacterium]